MTKLMVAGLTAIIVLWWMVIHPTPTPKIYHTDKIVGECIASSERTKLPLPVIYTYPTATVTWPIGPDDKIWIKCVSK